MKSVHLQLRDERSVVGSLVVVTTVLRLYFSYLFFGFHTGGDVEILRAGFMHSGDHMYALWAIRNLLLPA